MDKKEITQDQPFFVQFLEGQEFPRVKSDLKAGRPPFHTLKYPSDDDEDGLIGP